MVMAEWTGAYPNLCIGHWVLIVNGIDVSSKIPSDLFKTPMYTYGEYSNYPESCGEEGMTVCEDGLKKDEWISQNLKWLSTITKSKKVQEEIFSAISSKDWRYNSCGGCV